MDHEKHLSELFRRTPELLHIIFGNAVSTRTIRPSSYARVEYLGEHGFHAFLWAQNMEAAAYPRFLSIVRGEGEDQDFRHFRRGEFTSFVATRVEFLGRNVSLLTNDSELLDRLSEVQFSPNPPWIMYPDLGPLASYNQGEQEYWDRHVWTPFWKSLSPEQKDLYIDRRSEAALTYMLPEEWDDWVYSIRRNDPEYKHRHGL
ncbi:hypothetical protein [Paraburkholderia sp. DHOC27]|uniref:hypothetical protein n=1 Tax=Paraburkholderia sp. DHOC27 TaxID=2303330 RepID=UPI000E3DA787|nr:hypothetical protein [Paraburkholderia sp. DHOC27]RFU45343.1 hypothetical protein D0B32_22205 [Paraburkholderia sp. DHOC27]